MKAKVYFFDTKTAAKDYINIAFININAAKYIIEENKQISILNSKKQIILTVKY